MRRNALLTVALLLSAGCGGSLIGQPSIDSKGAPPAADTRAAGDSFAPAPDGAVSPDARSDSTAAPDAAAATDVGAPPTAPPAPPPPDPAAACKMLAPASSAAANTAAIQSCLDKHGIALLAAGSYSLSKGLVLPKGAKLRGLGTSYPTLVLSAKATNYLVSLTHNTEVGFLTLDANGKLAGLANASTVSIGGNDNTVHDNHILNGGGVATGDHSAGVYVIGDQVKGNVVDNNKIRRSFYGVIFRHGLTASTPNTLRNNDIYDIKCDSVTLAGYGRVLSNTIYRTGYDCENGPIPGGGIYSLNNPHGGLVEGNTIRDTCGHGIDMDRVQKMVIRANTISDPGYQWGGAHPLCGGAAGIALMETSDSTIEKNDVRNSGRANNRAGHGGDPNRVFGASSGATYADLPAGANTAVAFALVSRRNAVVGSRGNTVRDNTFIANCSGGCVGLGYFTSRASGYAIGGAWSAQTTNYFTGNSPFGSQVGSKRCGGNWYAANSTCGAAGGGDCNRDDYQHDPPVGDWARNDKCAKY